MTRRPKAILFDLGGTIWDDYPMELYQWELLRSLLSPYGLSPGMAELIALSEEVVHTYSPSVTRSMVFRLLDGDLPTYHAVVDQLVDHMKALFAEPGGFLKLNPLYTGMGAMLEELAASYPLGVVSQHFSEVEEWMEGHGIAQHFCHFSLSGRERLYKPDPRIFLHCCEALSLRPDEVMMVGDRLDNDIWPANRLGMSTVRVMADPYRIQRPRYHADVPDFTLERTTELPGLLASLAD